MRARWPAGSPLCVRVLLACAVALAARGVRAQVPSPASHFGFEMGAEGRLVGMEAVEGYFERVAAASDRVVLVDLGPTTEGHKTMGAIVSSPENIRNLDAIRDANQRLADPRLVPEADAPALIASHKVVVAIGCSIHASEVGATQAANDLLYALATADDPQTHAILDNVVVVLVPSLNPDGYRRVSEWYAAHRGTPFDGGPMPGLDHPYAGHDINRDAFMLNLAESRNLARFFYGEWHPQVFLSMHQMDVDGPRFFAPPNADPIDPNEDPVLWREAGLLGSAMTLELEQNGRRGVVSNAIYDYYWPGYEDSAPLGHNTVCLLTEVASVNVASAVDVPPDRLHANLKGLRDLSPHINYPNPWPGGHWTLRDIVDDDLTAARGLLRAAALYRADLVRNFYEMGRRAVAAGEAAGPFAFLIPADQRDPAAVRKLEDLLIQGGVEIFRTLEAFRADGDPYPAGTDVILLAQPYRAYVKTLLEVQHYPALRAADGSIERPYDVTAWTLPAQMGVDIRSIERWFEAPTMSRLNEAAILPARVWGESRPSFYLVDANGTAGAIAANRLLALTQDVSWTTEAFAAGGYTYPAGSLVVESSSDVRGAVETLARTYGLRADGVRGRRPATVRIARERIGLYKPWLDGIDEGWTRWLLEQYEFPFTSIGNAEIRSGGLVDRFDAIVLPSMPPASLLNGFPAGLVPDDYAGGLAGAGMDALVAFVKAGGTLVCLNASCGPVIDALQVPIRDVTAGSDDGRFLGPGSIVGVALDGTRPLTFGMPPRTAGFFAFSSAYELLPGSGDAVSVAARYATDDLLISGFLEGGDTIAGRAAIVEARSGEGRLVVLGFPVQHRAQSLAAFRLLFNALLLSH